MGLEFADSAFHLVGEGAENRHPRSVHRRCEVVTESLLQHPEKGGPNRVVMFLTERDVGVIDRELLDVIANQIEAFQAVDDDPEQFHEETLLLSHVPIRGPAKSGIELEEARQEQGSRFIGVAIDFAEGRFDERNLRRGERIHGESG